MKKIGFVIGLYGEEVNGGAEKHCKMLAERACRYYDVEVLTTTAKDYKTFTPFYKEGVEEINGVRVRRFRTIPFNQERFSTFYNKSRTGRKIRRFLYKRGLLRYVASLFPSWSLFAKKEIETLKKHGLYSPDLIDYVKTNEASYSALFLISYPCPNFYFINDIIPHKCIFIPTAHDEGDFFRAYLADIFTTIKHIAFNTASERDLCQRIFGNKMSSNSILAVGVELEEAADFSDVQLKYNLPNRYVLYFGRIAEEKIGNLIPWFIAYKNQSDDPVKLVLTGGNFMAKCEHPDIQYTGFVSESEKTALIKHAQLVVNPSDRESLSLLLLETMQLGKPALVNGKSEVMKQHCIDSNFAAHYYISKSDFIQKLNEMLALDQFEENEGPSRKAISYVEENYSWNKILERLNVVIDS
ncbi:glycosyltransferase [Sphingobacterium chuzhouense]|uniref:Glycosyltransferase n=1 Tax=Sphingobacterium chuzhouense TaxID=1742264 RepID=A0ABR7XM50_9SPHI|nr:glycosyltransferase [Sphingobacterium chuzhouense]MBD1420241.1 glycosyltransferase [Sphingobacterium chuzhouense]